MDVDDVQMEQVKSNVYAIEDVDSQCDHLTQTCITALKSQTLTEEELSQINDVITKSKQPHSITQATKPEISKNKVLSGDVKLTIFGREAALRIISVIIIMVVGDVCSMFFIDPYLVYQLVYAILIILSLSVAFSIFDTVVYGPVEAIPFCFGAESNQLFVKRLGSISKEKLSDLKLGDYVLSRDETGNIVWSKVWLIHEYDGKHPMIRLSYSYNDGSSFGDLTMSNDHLLYRNNFELIRADAIVIGDTVKLSDSKMCTDNAFTRGKIVKITQDIPDYARAPVTMHGDIIISSVLASCYTRSKANAEGLHKAGRVFRDISNINVQFAAFTAYFSYKYLYKPFRAFSMERLCEYYAFVPMFSALMIVASFCFVLYFL